MTDLSTLKIEYMNTVMKKHECVTQIVDGAALIIGGGEEGLREVVETQPEAILAAIAGMAAVLNGMETEHLQLIEQYFTSLDHIVELGGDIPSL